MFIVKLLSKMIYLCKIPEKLLSEIFQKHLRLWILKARILPRRQKELGY